MAGFQEKQRHYVAALVIATWISGLLFNSFKIVIQFVRVFSDQMYWMI